MYILYYLLFLNADISENNKKSNQIKKTSSLSLKSNKRNPKNRNQNVKPNTKPPNISNVNSNPNNPKSEENASKSNVRYKTEKIINPLSRRQKVANKIKNEEQNKSKKIKTEKQKNQVKNESSEEEKNSQTKEKNAPKIDPIIPDNKTNQKGIKPNPANSFQSFPTNQSKIILKQPIQKVQQPKPTPQKPKPKPVNRTLNINNNNPVRNASNHEEILIGIRNLGNTCFMNSTLQVLLNIPQFISDLIGSFAKIDKQYSSYSVLKELCLVYYDYVTTNKNFIHIDNFYDMLSEKVPYLCDGGQHDAAEFFQLLAESCENEILPSLISKIGSINGEVVFSKKQMLLNDPFAMNFGFSIITNIVCGKCWKEITEEVQTNFVLHLPLVSSSLEDCLAHSFQKEPILMNSNKNNLHHLNHQSATSSYFCDKCNNSSLFYLSTSLYRLPRFLFIQIERFDSSLTKNKRQIDMPNQIDLSYYINDNFYAQPKNIEVTSREQVNIESLYSFDSVEDGLNLNRKPRKSKVSENCSSIFEDEKMCLKKGFPNANYHLVSVILHEGSFSGGHYTAAILSRDSGTGGCSVISDESVYKNKEFNRSAPYCFIYQIDQ